MQLTDEQYYSINGMRVAVGRKTVSREIAQELFDMMDEDGRASVLRRIEKSSLPVDGPYTSRGLTVVADGDDIARVVNMHRSNGVTPDPEKGMATARLLAESWEMWQILRGVFDRYRQYIEDGPFEERIASCLKRVYGGR